MKFENTYLIASSSISVQDTFQDEAWFLNLKPLSNAFTKSVNPDYKQYLDPIATRRMSKVLKNAVLTTKQVMKKAELEHIDGVVIGTAWGCQEDTAKFLDSFERMGEELLSPTSFIQSTHNTIGGLIAMTVQCNGYNNTISHDVLSFETALIDTVFMMKESNASQRVLVGGVDEIIDLSAQLFEEAVCFKPAFTLTEGATQFIVSNVKPSNAAVSISRCELLDEQELAAEILKLKVDVILHSRAISSVIPCFNYQAWCGEYATSSSFGLFAAHELLQKEAFQQTLGLSKGVQKIAIVSAHTNALSSIIEIERC
jgi:3-oxoacyl-[acyl-carrier-protein] synthase II